MNNALTAQVAVAASDFTTETLTDIYNQTRVDYIVPMPMNVRRMEDYMRHYDVNADASIISFVGDQPSGIAMLGLRDRRAWITRLGVIPEARGQKTGSFLAETMLHQAYDRGADFVQLEVIRGNEPAIRLFTKYGFEVTRELLIVVRPPSAILPEPALPNANISSLSEMEILACLDNRPAGASWIEETSSITKMGNLHGYRLETDDGQSGWIVFRINRFQISHLIFDATDRAYDVIIQTLLTHLHTAHAGTDTKFENLPLEHRAYPLFQAAGYVESFRRFEMFCQL